MNNIDDLIGGVEPGLRDAAQPRSRCAAGEIVDGGLALDGGGLETNAGHTEHRQFIRLLLENERRIYAFIVSLLPDFNDAQDVLQETSITLWQKFGQYQPGSNFVAWACQIARFEVLDYYRRRHRSRLWLNQKTIDAVAQQIIAKEAVLEAREQALAKCLQQLGAADRDLLVRRYANEVPSRQMAAELGRSVNAIQKALARIRKSLMLCIQRKLKSQEQS